MGGYFKKIICVAGLAADLLNPSIADPQVYIKGGTEIGLPNIFLDDFLGEEQRQAEEKIQQARRRSDYLKQRPATSYYDSSVPSIEEVLKRNPSSELIVFEVLTEKGNAYIYFSYVYDEKGKGGVSTRLELASYQTALVRKLIKRTAKHFNRFTPHLTEKEVIAAYAKRTKDGKTAEVFHSTPRSSYVTHEDLRLLLTDDASLERKLAGQE